MKSRTPRGSTLLTALGATVVLALIVAGVLAYTGGEQERSSRSVRDLDAQMCAESAAQWGRKFYGERYEAWGAMLKSTSGHTNPWEKDITKWAVGSYGSIDGVATTADKADFRVTIADNIDEFPPGPSMSGFTPLPEVDNDLTIILRAECLIPRLKVIQPREQKYTTPVVATPDPYKWRLETVFAESSQTRLNKVIEVTLVHVPGNEYTGQRGGSGTGDQNVSQ